MEQLISTRLIQTYGDRELLIQTCGTMKLSRYSYLIERLIIQARDEATRLYLFKHKFEVFKLL
jgi:hypothetical protein